jgi:pimeloyl-ACP methyl ester carboxylesterase
MTEIPKTTLIATLACLALATATGANGQGVAPAEKCADLVGLQIPGAGMVITKAQAVPVAAPGTVRISPTSPATVAIALPSYCRAEGVIDPRVGVEGKNYGTGFAIALPDEWNGRFLFQGGGGLNGVVRPPLGAQAAGETPALARGFAVVSTDGGHTGAGFDASFRKDQQASLDFAYDAVGKLTPIAKQIIARYYRQPAKHSYFAGCSTGGREAMYVAQRYPSFFDGVVAGDPAMRTGYSNIGLDWAFVAFNRIAPKDDTGKPMPAQDFSAGDKKLLVDAILDACDATDGLKDGLIFATQSCRFDPAVLSCSGAKTDSCLSADQVGAVTQALGGPKDSRGRQVYPPFPYDTGITAQQPGAIPGLVPGAVSPLGPPNPPSSIDVDQRDAAIAANGYQLLADTAYWTNLSSFIGHGGKLLFYHGMSDPWFSPLDTLDYYERLARDNGGMEQAQQSSRIFLVPGMGHCAGGSATLDRFDLLGAVVDWVETGKAPDSVIATGAAFPGRSRPLCAYPKHAHYKGQGDPEDAESFECRP